jgi:RimJ/RimL family protein N-acetyltransferase
VSSSLVLDRNREVADWLEERLPVKFSGVFSTIGLERDGSLVAAWIFNDYQNDNIEIAVASDGAITRGFINAAADYVFNQLNCRRASCHVRTDNHKSIAFIERIGWVREGLRRQWFPDSDAYVYGMLKSECKWRL